MPDDPNAVVKHKVLNHAASAGIAVKREVVALKDWYHLPDETEAAYKARVRYSDDKRGDLRKKAKAAVEQHKAVRHFSNSS